MPVCQRNSACAAASVLVDDAMPSMLLPDHTVSPRRGDSSSDGGSCVHASPPRPAQELKHGSVFRGTKSYSCALPSAISIYLDAVSLQPAFGASSLWHFGKQAGRARQGRKLAAQLGRSTGVWEDPAALQVQTPSCGSRRRSVRVHAIPVLRRTERQANGQMCLRRHAQPRSLGLSQQAAVHSMSSRALSRAWPGTAIAAGCL